MKVLTEKEAEALTEARIVLHGLSTGLYQPNASKTVEARTEGRAAETGWRRDSDHRDVGYVSALAHVAEDAIFDLFNALSSHMDDEVAEEHLHLKDIIKAKAEAAPQHVPTVPDLKARDDDHPF